MPRWEWALSPFCFISSYTLLVGWLAVRRNKFFFQLCESIQSMPKGEGELCSIFWKHNTWYNCIFDMHSFDSLRFCVLYMEIYSPVLETTCWVNDNYEHIIYHKVYWVIFKVGISAYNMVYELSNSLGWFL